MSWLENNVEKEDNERRIKTFRDTYIGYLNPVTLISDNKLKLNRNSDEYYRTNIVLLKNLPLRNTNSSEKQMRDCFNWFYAKISKQFKTGKALAGFIDSLVDKLFFTVIEVTNQINAFKVFETLNARGVQLSSSDLLKNYLFSVVDSTRPHRSEIDELEILWSSIIGKLGNKKFEDYLRYFWNSYNRTVRKVHLFKTIKKSILSKQQAFNLIRQLRDNADLYMAIQEPESEFWTDLQVVRKALRELKLFNIKQTHSLLIAAYRNLDNKRFLKLVKMCVIISFRYNVIGGLNPNEQEDVYNKIAQKISSTKALHIEDLRPVYVLDNNFVHNFASKQFKNTTRNHKIVKYIYSKIEAYYYNNEISPESDLYSIEHILPENSDESWGSFSNDEINRSIYRLGNLSLLEKKLNREAGSLSYSEKKKIFKKSNSNITNSIPEEFESWSEAKIAERQKNMAKTCQIHLENTSVKLGRTIGLQLTA